MKKPGIWQRIFRLPQNDADVNKYLLPVVKKIKP